jgi:hypothetical protein
VNHFVVEAYDDFFGTHFTNPQLFLQEPFQFKRAVLLSFVKAMLLALWRYVPKICLRF